MHHVLQTSSQHVHDHVKCQPGPKDLKHLLNRKIVSHCIFWHSRLFECSMKSAACHIMYVTKAVCLAFTLLMGYMSYCGQQGGKHQEAADILNKCSSEVVLKHGNVQAL